MEIKRTDEKLIKDIEELNKQEIKCINFDKQIFEYIGVYSLLDELLDRIKKCNNLGDIERYTILFIQVYKLVEKVEDKGE